MASSEQAEQPSQVRVVGLPRRTGGDPAGGGARRVAGSPVGTLSLGSRGLRPLAPSGAPPLPGSSPPGPSPRDPSLTTFPSTGPGAPEGPPLTSRLPAPRVPLVLGQVGGGTLERSPRLELRGPLLEERGERGWIVPGPSLSG